MSRADSAQTDPLEILDGLVARTRAAGAGSADAVMFESAALSVSYRLGKPEDLERAESMDIGLRVLLGKRQAFVSSGDPSPAALDELVERAMAMARAAPEDPYCGLADPELLAGDVADLDLDDPAPEPTAESLTERVAAAEAAALAVPGVANSEGAEASWGRTSVALATSDGFRGAYRATSHGIAVSVVAGRGTRMERDYDYCSTRHLGDLDDPDALGRSAGERAVKRLHPRKVPSGSVPVVFDPRVANGLVGHLSAAVNGAAVARGTSFLRDSMGERIFAPGIDIVDDPHRPRGLRSKPFDGEGVAGSRRRIVADGRLTTWLLDSAAARQLGLTSTGHAGRGAGAPPAPAATNLYMAAGAATPGELMADIGTGLYVTELIGFGVNQVTGDYSRGAAGFWIERGEIAHPVSELTIAGHLKDMFAALTPADDLVFRYGTNAPTIRVDGMTVAGT